MVGVGVVIKVMLISFKFVYCMNGGRLCWKRECCIRGEEVFNRG